MTEPVVNSEVSQVEAEYRIRNITLEPVRLNSPVVVNFDSFALEFVRKKSEFGFVSKISTRVISGQSDPPFYLNNFSEPWKVEVKVVFCSAEDEAEVLQELDVPLSNEEPCVNHHITVGPMKFVVINLEFRKLEGLSVEPLRNYAVANKYSDVTIIVEGQKFKLNKTSLASHSSYFEKLFLGDFSEKNREEIELKDVCAEAFTDLLDLLTLSMHQLHRKAAIFAVLKLADMLDVPLVIKRIENMLRMYPGLRALNIAEKLWAADKYGMKMVLMHVMSTWTTVDSEKYVTGELWNDLKPATTLHLFKTLGKQIQKK